MRTTIGNLRQIILREVFSFKEGDRVVLKANPEEGWIEETGTVLGDSGNQLYVVQVDKKHINSKHDDGTREVNAEDMLPEKMPLN